MVKTYTQYKEIKNTIVEIDEMLQTMKKNNEYGTMINLLKQRQLFNNSCKDFEKMYPELFF